ncbi:hypothetical protein TVNIR_1240 [Thioalkalivibrio nitratireducens DSM 14787]|uniref:Uncharacterized protein n=1 Tax=Thioalkalivibrio nitratireducens (strain DSM 14787 / UNIQEM 213 / ALEN2) TaxID=1255043 RepID=L0DV66_THIND|nr:hypothetical protein [Thioalkalivibrio nitratireducens]AGA32913.1 hypothetical protein TVNIR_1240 [Thioalkalivibrio nitratireducens DSM 14787]
MVSFTLEASDGGLEMLNPLLSVVERVVEPVLVALNSLLFPLVGSLPF